MKCASWQLCAAQTEASEASGRPSIPTAASEDDHVCAQVACRFQDRDGRMTVSDDRSEIARRSFYLFIRA